MPHVARIGDPRALTVPEVQELFRQAFPKGGVMMAPMGFEDAVEDFVRLILSPDAAVFLGAEKGGLKSLLVVMLPQGKLFPTPQVVAFFNTGSAWLKKEMANALVDFLVQRGYSRFWAINATGAPDEVWSRAHKAAGEAKAVGTLMEFSVG